MRPRAVSPVACQLIHASVDTNVQLVPPGDPSACHVIPELVCLACMQVAMTRRDLALRLRDARRADRRLETVAQYKQAMTAPDWEMDDYDWCVHICSADLPLWCPSL